jgi:hypothetical protein
MLITIKPAKTGGILRDPADGYSLVPSAGKQVKSNVYWRRRIADGDAVLVTETTSTAGASASTTSEATTASSATTAATTATTSSSTETAAS